MLLSFMVLGLLFQGPSKECPKCGAKIPEKAVVCYACKSALMPFVTEESSPQHTILCPWCARPFSGLKLHMVCPYCLISFGGGEGAFP